MFIFPGVITVEDFLTYPLLLFSQTDYNDKVNVAKDVVNSVTSRGDIFSKYNFSYNGMGFLFSLDDDVHVRFQYKAKLIEYELIDEKTVKYRETVDDTEVEISFVNQEDFNDFVAFLDERNKFVRHMIDKSIEKSENLFQRMISTENIDALDKFFDETSDTHVDNEIGYLIFLYEFCERDELCSMYFHLTQNEYEQVSDFFHYNETASTVARNIFDYFSQIVTALTKDFSYISDRFAWLVFFHYYNYYYKLRYSNIWKNEYDNIAITTDVENYVKDCVCRNTVSSWNDRSIVSLTYYLLQENALCDEFRFARKKVEQYVKEEEQGKPRTHIKEVKTYSKGICSEKDDNASSYGEEPNKSSASAIKELESLIGLTSVKSDVEELVSLVKLNLMRKNKGLPEIPVSLHLVFTGNPGTGKTTVARILAKIYKEIGILSKGQLVEVDRSGLVAGYVGQTAIKTQEKIQKAIGGILFIDEAYTLVKDGNDFGQEAIDTILKAMEDKRENLVVIVAGYPELMKKFISSNPGLRSRFNKYIHFDDYSINELVDIFDRIIGKYHYTITDEAKRMVVDKIALKVSEKDASFANAREIRNMFEHIVSAQALRVAKMNNPSEEDITQITEEDIV